MQSILAAGYTVQDRTRIFGKAGDQLPSVRHAEQQKYRAAKRSTIRAGRKVKPKKK